MARVVGFVVGLVAGGGRPLRRLPWRRACSRAAPAMGRRTQPAAGRGADQVGDRVEPFSRLRAPATVGRAREARGHRTGYAELAVRRRWAYGRRAARPFLGDERDAARPTRRQGDSAYATPAYRLGERRGPASG